MPSPVPAGPAWLRSPVPEEALVFTAPVRRATARVEQGATDEGLKRMASSALQGYLQDLKLLTREEDPGWLAELYRWPASLIAANLCDLLDLAPGVLEDARDRQLRQSGLLEYAARCAEELPAEVDLTPLEPLRDGPDSQNVHNKRRRSGTMPAAPEPSETVQTPAVSAAPHPASPATTTSRAEQPQHKRQWLPGRGWITKKVRTDEQQQRD